MIYVVKLTFSRNIFQTTKSDSQPFLGQLKLERVIYLKRKPYYQSFKNRFETGRISIMTGSTQVLVKVVLVQLRGHGHPQNDATPNFFPDSKSSILGFSNKVTFFSKSLQDGCKKQLKRISENISIADQCVFSVF